MRRTLGILVALLPLAAAGLSMPAAAENHEGGCVAAPNATDAGPIDLEKIPAKPVVGALSVQAGEDCAGPDDERSAQADQEGVGHETADLDD